MSLAVIDVPGAPAALLEMPHLRFPSDDERQQDGGRMLSAALRAGFIGLRRGAVFDSFLPDASLTEGIATALLEHPEQPDAAVALAYSRYKLDSLEMMVSERRGNCIGWALAQARLPQFNRGFPALVVPSSGHPFDAADLLPFARPPKRWKASEPIPFVHEGIDCNLPFTHSAAAVRFQNPRNSEDRGVILLETIETHRGPTVIRPGRVTVVDVPDPAHPDRTIRFEYRLEEGMPDIVRSYRVVGGERTHYRSYPIVDWINPDASFGGLVRLLNPRSSLNDKLTGGKSSYALAVDGNKREIRIKLRGRTKWFTFDEFSAACARVSRLSTALHVPPGEAEHALEVVVGKAEAAHARRSVSSRVNQTLLSKTRQQQTR